MSDQQPRHLSDVESLKALAHPLRGRLLGRLQRDGPATSADLAAAFGEDRGATSYHLRQLARFGFIEEDTGRSAGRRRYWRAVRQDLRLPMDPADPEAAQAAELIGRHWLAEADRALTAYLADRPAHGPFADAAVHSFGALRLTAAQLTRFGEEYLALLNAWHERAAAEQERAPEAETRPVTVVLHAFPTPEPDGESA